MTIHASSQPVSPLRRRMLDDMAMRGMREATQRDYIRFVQSFAAFLKRPPDTATAEDTRSTSRWITRMVCIVSPATQVGSGRVIWKGR